MSLKNKIKGHLTCLGSDSAVCLIKNEVSCLFHEVFLLKGQQSKLSFSILTVSSTTFFLSRGQNPSWHWTQFIPCKWHFAVGNVTLSCLQCCPEVGLLKGLETDSGKAKTFEKQGSDLDLGMAFEPLSLKISSPKGNSTCFIQPSSTDIPQVAPCTPWNKNKAVR